MMTPLELTSPIETTLCQKLSEFEALFDYPLGKHQRFRIDHSPDYTAFYRAIGQASTWIVQDNDRIIAAISTAIRTITIKGIEQKIAYVGDLKIHPRYQSGSVLFKIARCLQPLLEHAAIRAYSVVMDGTKVTPEQYTGRLGIPAFKPVAKVHILRFETAMHVDDRVETVTANEGYKLYKQLLTNAAHCVLASTEIRSLQPPCWFISHQAACGMVEDTRQAKRLYLESGEEFVSAHLSYFTFKDASEGRQVLKSVIQHVHRNEYPAVFVALSEEQLVTLAPFLRDFRYTDSSATIYATDNVCAHIPINTAEI